MIQFLVICLLGGLGATARWGLAKWQGSLPWGILAANTIAAIVATLALNGAMSVYLIAGLAGGLSTFSTLVGQTAELWSISKQKAALNLLLNLVVPSTIALGFGISLVALLK